MNPIVNQEPYASFLAPKTIETKITYAQNLSFIRRFLKKEVYEATPNELKAFFLDCQTRGIKMTTMQTYKASIFSFFNHLAINEEADINKGKDPVRFIKAINYIKEEIDTSNKDETIRKALTPAQREKVYECLRWEDGIHEFQISLAIEFGFKVGLRRFEIAKVQWSDIDFDARTLTVLGKGAKKATVPLAKPVLARLKDYEMLVKKAGIDSRWVFWNIRFNDPSKHVLKWTIALWYKLIKKRAGLGDDILFSTHDGRRIFCTTLHENDVKDLTAIKLTRHKNVGVYKGYVRIDSEELDSEINRVNKVVE